MWSRLSRVERASLALLVAAVAVRAAQAWAYRDHLVWDVAWYVTMARSFVEHGEFFEPATGNHTHHYPPLWPLLLAAFQALSGHEVLAAKVLGFLAGLGMAATVGGLTWHLYGRQAGLVAAALFAAFPALVQYDALGYPESLLVALYAVTLWSIVTSLRRPPLILVGGLSAGLAYLTKASVGPFFLLAAAGGLAWRLHHRRGAVFRDTWYLAAGAVFALLVGLWTSRNVLRFGLSGWETQPYATEALRAAFDQPGWALVLLMKAAFAAIFLAAVTYPWWDRLRRPVREVLRDEAASALWLAALMPAFIALFFMLAFKYAENRPVWDPDDARYLLVSLVPLLWLALDPKRAPPETAEDDGTRGGRLVAWGVVLLLFLLLALDPRAESQARRDTPAVVATACALVLAGAALLGWREQGADVRRRSAPERAIALAMEAGVFPRAALACGLVVVASYAGWSILLPAAVAAAGATLVRGGAHARALAFAAILLGATLAGATLTVPWVAAAGTVDGALAPGENVAGPAKRLHFAAAALDAPLVPWEQMDNRTRFVILPAQLPPEERPFVARLLQDYHVVATHNLTSPVLPGTAALRALREAFAGAAPPAPPGAGLVVLERNAPGAAPAG